jgi:beta-1,4-mannosyltransferase
MENSSIRHFLHCILLAVTITVSACLQMKFMSTQENGWEGHETISKVLIYVNACFTIISFPTILFIFLGLTVYNAWPDKVKLRQSLAKAPFICFRVVTRGDYRELVDENTKRHIETCLAVGFENFSVEVVTNKALNLPKHPRLREIIVPDDYQTENGTMFKARNLQYCLEENVNILNPNDWIVHLDEDSNISENCVRGILNFVSEGKYAFGQGAITNLSKEVPNWFTALADTSRMAGNIGGTKFQFKAFERPIFGWNGSFMVMQVRCWSF